ncbi:MAG: hypothetical protein ACJ8FY_23895 [Gemmataceae bacterium]
MSRFFLTSVVFVFLAALASADSPLWPTAAEQAHHLERNADLIEKLVDGGLDLAQQKSALDRAKSCGTLAARLSDEIQKAAADRDSARTLELSQHLRLVLQRGIAANLSTARREIHPGSAEEAKLFEGTSQASQLIHDLEQQLKRALAGEENRMLDQPLSPARRGCESVEKAIRELGKP